ncbi:MAG: anti-sigma factor family protein [Vicinamibacteria bacterium]
MNCRGYEDLMSDYIEETLSPPLRRDLAAHLDACASCRALLATLEEVIAILGSYREPAAPRNLTELVLERTCPVRDAARKAATELDVQSGQSFWRSAASAFAAAAVLTTVLIVRPPEILAGWSRSVSQTAHQGYSLGVRTYHRTARWIEDLNVLRMTVGVAFENRLDRLNERLRDLEDARRKSDANDETSRSGDLPETRLSQSANSTMTRSLL